MTRLKYIWLFLGVMIFLICTIPENHTEAEDTYYYARMVETGGWGEMFHQHHLLYLPMARGVYRAVQSLGYSGRALPVLIGLSMASAAMVICLLAVTLRGRGQSRLWVLPLLFSYGFWRYACAAEIYLPASAAVFAAWVFAKRPRGVWFATSCSVVALLLHLVCLPAVVATGLFFVLRKEWKAAGIYFLSTATIVLGVYGLVHVAAEMVVFKDALVLRASLMEPATWVKALFAFGQNLLSGNFLFSIPLMAEKLTGLFPYHMFQEELFMGLQAGRIWQAVSVGTFCLALLSLGWAFYGLMRSARAWRTPAAVWFVGNVAMALLFEPANPEMWVFTLLPFWLLVSNTWKPAAPAPKLFSKHWKILLPILAAGLLLHNWVGGMSFVKSGKGDYCRQKADWIVKNGSPDDAVVFADSHSFSTYLEYWTHTRTFDAKLRSFEIIFQALENRNEGRVFVYDDVITPLPPVLLRTPESVAQIRALARVLKQGLCPVSGEPDWKIYEWKPAR